MISVNVLEINSLVLAYLGDNIYETFVRKYLINNNISNVNDLQKEAIKYVSAIKQAEFLSKLISIDFFSEEEMSIIKRARNCKSNSHPRNCDVLTYKHATALEALIGYLEIINNRNRIEEIMTLILGGSL